MSVITFFNKNVLLFMIKKDTDDDETQQQQKRIRSTVQTKPRKNKEEGRPAQPLSHASPRLVGAHLRLPSYSAAGEPR